MVSRPAGVAARRAAKIVQGQKLSESDFVELLALCKLGRTPNPTPADPQPKPLGAAHLPASPGAGASVPLMAIKNVSAVNNLAPAQTLTFAPNGITVIYGDNAAGKSGYSHPVFDARGDIDTVLLAPAVARCVECRDFDNRRFPAECFFERDFQIYPNLSVGGPSAPRRRSGVRHARRHLPARSRRVRSGAHYRSRTSTSPYFIGFGTSTPVTPI